MSQFKINSITDKTGISGPVIAGVSTNNSTGCMIIPAGPTEHRGGRGRAVFSGGYKYSSPYNIGNVMQFVQISTLGNTADFGDAVVTASVRGTAASATIGLFAGGYNTSSNAIDFVIMSSGGGSLDWGDLSSDPTLNDDTNNMKRYLPMGLSNTTRGYFVGGTKAGGGFNQFKNIDLVNFSSKGNTSLFGFLNKRRGQGGSFASSTRGVFGGGRTADPDVEPDITIDFITLSTSGEETKFGDLTAARSGSVSGASSSTRGLFTGGLVAPLAAANVSDIMDYVTIATQSNAIDFGNLTAGRVVGSSSNNIRAINAGGFISSALVNTIDYVTIATTGNAVDFGDLSTAGSHMNHCSDAHGGLIQ